MLDIVNFGLLLLLVVLVGVFVYWDSLLISAVVACALSVSMSVLYLVLGAPDVAITEAAVGAGFSTVLMLVTLSNLGWGYEPQDSPWRNGVAWGKKACAFVLSVAMFLLLSSVVMELPYFGNPESPANVAVPSYVGDAQVYTGVPNLVAAILASFRGYDTLCETIVVFTAAMGVSLLISKNDLCATRSKDVG